VTPVSGYATTFAWQEGPEDLTCAEAAALLGVPPAALERWAQRMAFPQPDGTGGAARFKRAEIEALRDALVSAHSVEGAVRAARARTGA
jgi:predicted DNA-binding transcriptional regulator AlpA